MGRRKTKVVSNVTISDMSAEGMGVGRYDGKVVFVEQAVEGDVVDVLVYKKKKGFEIGRIHEFHSKSEHRRNPQCEHFGVCGGCKWMHTTYSEQLRFKENQVVAAFQRIGKVETPEVQPIMGCSEEVFYRNKLEYTFTNRRFLSNEEVASGQELDRNGIGFHAKGSFDRVVDLNTCYLQSELSNRIRIGLKDFCISEGMDFYDLRNHEGLLRNLIVRSTNEKEVLVLIVFKYDHEDIQKIVDYLKDHFPEITSIQYAINPKVNENLFDIPVEVAYGPAQIHERIGHCLFKIAAKSFFQTNSKQAEQLYSTTLKLAELQSNDVVYDLFTGVGSIALYVSGSCKKVVGIEEVNDAIVDAGKNAELNGIQNSEFHCGDVRAILNPDFIEEHGKPDVIITDPPRAGMHKDVVDVLLKSGARRIVYVSCNPSTQARDVELLSEKYAVSTIQPVDMFPQTPHVENIAVLDLNQD